MIIDSGVVSTLVTPLALERVAPAPVSDDSLGNLHTLVFMSLWGAIHLSRAKKIVFSILALDHTMSPGRHVSLGLGSGVGVH